MLTFIPNKFTEIMLTLKSESLFNKKPENILLIWRTLGSHWDISGSYFNIYAFQEDFSISND